MAALPALEVDDPSAVLAAVRLERSIADQAEANLLRLAVDWAAMHSTDSLAEAACFEETHLGDAPVPVAGPGAPMVAEFSIHEFATAIGLPTEVGKAYVGEAVELRYRLRRVWARLQAGDLQAWRARRIARTTMSLSVEAAAYVDRHIAHVAHRIRPSALDRLIDEATARYMPDVAAQRAAEAAEHRHFDIHTRDLAGFITQGTVDVTGTLDLADALDLDKAVTQIASGLKECGSDASLDVRRAQAVGELARRQLAFDFQPEDGTTDKQVLLHLHVRADESGVDPVAHLDALPLMLEQVKTWCRNGKVTVKPIVDLNERLSADAYEIPDRIRTQVLLINPTCVFPWCGKKSRGLDLDHVTPWPLGPTATDNLAPLCRSHHRAKTFGRWTYRVITPGTYAWRSPHGYTYRTDSSGTTDTGPDPGR